MKYVLYWAIWLVFALVLTIYFDDVELLCVLVIAFFMAPDES